MNTTQWQNYGTAGVSGRLQMTWNSSGISAQRINIELWGYTESGGGASLRYLYSLRRNLTNTGAFSFTPQPKREYSDWELGNVRITAASNSEGERYPNRIRL